jgi:regulator of replication initiation timing
LSLAELRQFVGTLVAKVAEVGAEIAAMKAENQALRDEVARLKGLLPRPPSRPFGMEKATVAPGRARAARGYAAGGVPSATARR